MSDLFIHYFAVNKIIKQSIIGFIKSSLILNDNFNFNIGWCAHLHVCGSNVLIQNYVFIYFPLNLCKVIFKLIFSLIELT